jgi:hypothetical protein
MTKEEALAKLEEVGTIYLEVSDGPEIPYEEELSILGVDTDAIYRSLRQMDYYTMSIKMDGEYHHAEDLAEERDAIQKEWDKAELEEYGIYYELD